MVLKEPEINMTLKEPEIKPKLRGIIHAVAFVCTAVSTLIFLVASFISKFNLGIFIYLVSQLIQYGASSIYHIPSWSPKVKKILRHIDHISIFILISGTQTSVILNSTQIRDSVSSLFLKISWALSALGITKIILMNKLHNFFDLVFYCVHGIIILPFYKILACIHIFDKVLMIIGGIIYLAGGVIFGLEKPNPFPKVFGWHEVFHVFTIIANMCFSIIITRNYIFGFFNKK